MRKIYFIVCCLFLVSVKPAWAQRRIKQMDSDKQAQQDEAKEYEKTPLKDKLVFGGNFWLSLSSYYSQVYIQPLVGYKVTPKTIVGGGFTYIYFSQTTVYGGKSYENSDNIYGLNAFARQTLFGPLFAHAEFQPMNFRAYNYSTGESKRIWTQALYLGGGINQSIGKDGRGAYILFLYDVLWQDPYANPFGFPKSFYPTPYNIRFGVFL